MTPFDWTADHLALIDVDAGAFAPLIRASAMRRVSRDLDLWDHWPVLEERGGIADFDGRRWVICLAAPVCADPETRHFLARLWLFSVAGDDWVDLGPVFPEGFTPGSREWAGSALVDRNRGELRLFFTATGVRGETVPSFRQRMMVSRAPLVTSPEGARPGVWDTPRDIVQPEDVHYQSRHAGEGGVGVIKAFRDPFVFTDPRKGREQMVFTGSSAARPGLWNGVVGWANVADDGWTLRPPLVSATGVNNELERPHVVIDEARIYLFWSTQAHVFAPGVTAPTGLYGVVADDLEGPWTPLNGSGLVFANPPTAPTQAYSWQVLPDLSVWSFADRVRLVERPVPATAPAFGGTPAPPLALRLDGACASLV